MRPAGRVAELGSLDRFDDAMKDDEYIVGDHHFWIHFWCGLVFGAGIGVWISSALFDSRWAFIGSSAAIALVVAFCCGRWGDPIWHRLLELLQRY